MTLLRAVIFDLDDTLYPERAYVFSGFRAVADWAETQFGVAAEQCVHELYQLFNTNVRQDTFDRWLLQHDIKPECWVKKMVRVYREHTPSIAPHLEVKELLVRLRRRYRVGLVSDGYAAVQRGKLTSLGLADYFDCIVFSDELGRSAWKPSCLPFRVILKRLGLEGYECVYVADNPSKDFLGARLVGMRTVRIRYGDGLYAGLEAPAREYAPDAEIKQLGRLGSILVPDRRAHD